MINKRYLLCVLASSFFLPVFAQFRVEVSGVGLTQLPIAISAFRGEDEATSRLSAEPAW